MTKHRTNDRGLLDTGRGPVATPAVHRPRGRVALDHSRNNAPGLPAGTSPQDLASEPPEQQLYWRRQRSLVQLRQVGAFDPFPPWVVQLTTSPHRDGDCWMLDTSDGTLTKFVITGAGEDDPAARYDDTDPRAWRNAGEDKTYKLEALLAKWAGKYRRMEYLGVPGHQSIRGVVWRDAEFGRPGRVSLGRGAGGFPR
ncbi:hypothetical protein PG987_001109 [Apiospora arundinis]